MMVGTFGTDMKKYIALLTFLISSLTVTGISFVDGKIWDIVFLVIGMIAYAIVGVLFSIGVLHGKQAGKDAYVFVFLLLLLGGYGFYKLLELIRNWILSWPLFVKIMVPSLIAAGICAGIFFVVQKMIVLKKRHELAKKSESI